MEREDTQVIGSQPYFIAPTADVSSMAHLGSNTQVWHLTQVREEAVIGDGCIIGRGVYVDHGVVIGRNCKVQNGAQLFAPARLEDGVFIGPGAIITNDRIPRAVTPELKIKTSADWEPAGVTIRLGASVGAGAVVMAGVTVGAWSLIGAGAVVTRDVPFRALVVGTPASRVRWVDLAGNPMDSEGDGLYRDTVTGERFLESGDHLQPVQ